MIVNSNAIIQHVIQIKNRIIINFNLSAKSIISANNPSTFIYENSRYLKSIVGGSVIASDKIMNIVNNASTNVKNTISKNVTSPVSINFDDKKVRYKMDCYIFHTLLLVTIMTIMCDQSSDHYDHHFLL